MLISTAISSVHIKGSVPFSNVNSQFIIKYEREGVHQLPLAGCRLKEIKPFPKLFVLTPLSTIFLTYSLISTN